MGDPLRELKQWEAAGQDVLLVLAVFTVLTGGGPGLFRRRRRARRR